MPATALEQMILELVNRARLDPAAEAARYGIALNEGVAAADTISTASKQPLAMNETLLGTARAHSQDMIDRDYFAHDTPEGVTPFQRMTNAGYNFTTAGENIALTTSSNPITNQNTIDLHQFLFVDLNFPGRGHRVNILNGDYQEIGVGQATGNFQGSNGSALTEDFGTRGNQQFLTGVSYADADHDNFYSIGEGRGSMLVGVTTGGSTSTGAAGGYSLAVSSGLRTVTFSGGGLTSAINVSVSIAANTNAKVDVIDQGTIATSASLTDLGGATTIIGLGTFGLALTGDSGNDKFIGTKGNDTIDGAGGTDTVVFSGNASAYTRTNQPNGSIQVAGPDGTDTVSNVEFLQFNDQTIAVSTVAGSIVIDDQTLSEGNSGTKLATFTVTRSGGTAAFDVNFATADNSATVAGGDYVAKSGTLHFDAGVNTQTISVTINGDTQVEFKEAFLVNLSGATNGATISDGQGIGTITNDDAGAFAPVTFELAAFAPGAGGWNSGNQYPREVADVNGDHMADIVGFGADGVIVSLATGNGHFGALTAGIANFGSSAAGGGWTSDNQYPRQVADVNGDGMADIVGFGADGVIVSLATGGGHFASPVAGISNYGFLPAGGGWVSQNQYPRLLADVNGDHMADIVGFGADGVIVSLATGGGHFASPVAGISNYGFLPAGGGWVSQDQYPRLLADVNGDHMADIVGFGADGVIVSLATGGGHFASPVAGIQNFGFLPAGGGWVNQNQYPREVADVNNDGMADIVGYSADGVIVSMATGGGHFAAPVIGIDNFGNNAAGGGWVSQDLYPRALGDVNGDGAADIIGFGHDGVLEALSNGFHLI
jgi:hypothetical protein